MDQKDTARFGGLAFGSVLSGPKELSFEHEVLSGLSRLIWLIQLMVLICFNFCCLKIFFWNPSLILQGKNGDSLSRGAQEENSLFCNSLQHCHHIEWAFPAELFLAVFCNLFGTVFCSLPFFARFTFVSRFHTFVSQICFLWGGV